jgi:hypothetical protein
MTTVDQTDHVVIDRGGSGHSSSRANRLDPMKHAFLASALVALFVAGSSCGGGSDQGSLFHGGAGGTGAGTGAGGSGVGGAGGAGALGGFGGGIVVDSGSNSSDANPDAPCQAVGQEVQTEALPVDIIWAVDTSGSMFDEAAAVQENINAFSQQISAANIDVHVVMLAEEQLLGINICVGAPLGTGNCGAPGGDSKPPTFFHHPTAVVDSWNGALKFVDTFPDYQQFIRPNSLKYLVMVTDDDGALFPGIPFPVTCDRYCDNPTAFINDVTALPGMRTASGAPAWKMSGVYAQTQCLNATRPAVFWKAVIDQTGGVHGDLCACTDPAACSQTFEAVLDSLSKTITSAAKPLDCEYAIPAPPPGQTFDKEKVNVDLTVNGAVESIGWVSDAAACHPEVGGWYYDDNVNPTRILTCPKSCEKIKATTSGRVAVAFGCVRKPINVPQ